MQERERKTLYLNSSKAVRKLNPSSIFSFNRRTKFIFLHLTKRFSSVFLNSMYFLVYLSLSVILTLTRPLRRKLRMRWFFDVSKVKESSFFKSDLTDPPQNFVAHLLDTTNLSPSRFHFSVSFNINICFDSDSFIAYSNEWDRREKRCLLTLISLLSHHLI